MSIIHNWVYISIDIADFADGENLNGARMNQLLQALEDLDSKIPVKPYDSAVPANRYMGTITAPAADATNSFGVLSLVQNGYRNCLNLHTTYADGRTCLYIKTESRATYNSAINIDYSSASTGSAFGISISPPTVDSDTDNKAYGLVIGHRGRGPTIWGYKLEGGATVYDKNFYVDADMQCWAIAFNATSQKVYTVVDPSGTHYINYNFKLPDNYMAATDNMSNFLLTPAFPAGKSCSHFHLKDSTATGIFKFTTDTTYVGKAVAGISVDLAAQKLTVDGINLKTMIQTLGSSGTDVNNLKVAMTSNRNTNNTDPAAIGSTTKFHAYYAA